jgi:hypothetical protein
MNNSILAIVAVLAAVAMLSVAVGVVPLQEAEARRRGGDCSGDGSFCFSQNQINRCKDFADCSSTATATITIG